MLNSPSRKRSLYNRGNSRASAFQQNVETMGKRQRHMPEVTSGNIQRLIYWSKRATEAIPGYANKGNLNAIRAAVASGGVINNATMQRAIARSQLTAKERHTENLLKKITSRNVNWMKTFDPKMVNVTRFQTELLQKFRNGYTQTVINLIYEAAKLANPTLLAMVLAAMPKADVTKRITSYIFTLVPEESPFFDRVIGLLLEAGVDPNKAYNVRSEFNEVNHNDRDYKTIMKAPLWTYTFEDRYYSTPLAHAIKTARWKLFQRLLPAMKPESIRDDGYALAALEKYLRSGTWYLENNANVHSATALKMFHALVNKGALLAAGTPNHGSFSPWVPVLEMSWRSRDRNVDAILVQKIKPLFSFFSPYLDTPVYLQEYDTFTPLEHASRKSKYYGKYELFTLLAQHADQATLTKVLYYAIENDYHDQIPILLKCGANANNRTPPREPALHFHIYHSISSSFLLETFTRTAEALIRGGVSIDQRSLSGETPLQYLTGSILSASNYYKSISAIIEWLVRHGANVNAVDANRKNMTPLMNVVSRKHWPAKDIDALARLMLAHGAKPWLTDADGNTAADYLLMNIDSNARKTGLKALEKLLEHLETYSARRVAQRLGASAKFLRAAKKKTKVPYSSVREYIYRPEGNVAKMHIFKAMHGISGNIPQNKMPEFIAYLKKNKTNANQKRINRMYQ